MTDATPPPIGEMTDSQHLLTAVAKVTEATPPAVAEQTRQAILQAIYGNVEDKKAAYENSLRRWWTEYADRKADEDDDEEHVANSLLYDKRHLPRTAPAPECVAQRVSQSEVQQACQPEVQQPPAPTTSG